MAVNNTLKATPDKTTYNKGETITVTASGDYTSTADVNVTGLLANFTLGDGSKVAVTVPAFVVKDGQTIPGNPVLTSITNDPGRVWTVANGRATGVA